MKLRNNIPEGYKPSPLGAIPNEWGVKELGQLFEFKNGINAGKESYGDGVKFVNVMEVIGHHIITPAMIPGKVNISDQQKRLYAVKNGDVLFNRTSEIPEEIGLSAVYEGKEDVVFGGFVIRARPLNGDLCIPFRRYCFRSIKVRNQIITRGQGAVRSNIGQGDLEKVLIPLPPLKEQIAIAEILAVWDKAINAYAQLISKKQLRRKWLMQQLLTGKKRLKGSKAKWQEVHVRDIAQEVSLRNTNANDLTVLSCTKHRGLVPSLEYFGRKIFSNDLSTYKIVPKFHFAYATNHIEEGSIGYQQNYKEALISPMYTVFRTNKHQVNDDFLFRVLKSYQLIFQYTARMEGSIDRRGGLRWDAFSLIKIQLPSLDEQTEIAKVLNTADNEILILQKQLSQVSAQKKWLMHVLLTGKVRLKKAK